MSTDHPDASRADHPWRHISLEVYERHMGDARVAQLQRLHDITAEQLAAFPSRTIGILGVAGGNGLDLVDPLSIDDVYGYDINLDYLHACDLRVPGDVRETPPPGPGHHRHERTD